MVRGGEVRMSNLEHLIENSLCRLNEGKSYREWREIMQQDCNWEGNENITLDNLWEICQYVIFISDFNRTYEKQDAIEPVNPLSPVWGNIYFCGKCGYPVGKHNNYCSECGKKVKWHE